MLLISRLTGIALSLAAASLLPGTAQARTPQLAAPRAEASTRGDDATLNSVTCVSATSCQATGFFYAAAEGGFIFGLAEEYIGSGQWGLNVLSGNGSKDDVMDSTAVSCGAPGSCMAVGEHYDNPKLPVQFADTLGVTWTPVLWNNPAHIRWSALGDVQCIGSSLCLAVGAYSRTSGGGRTLAERWDGHSWSVLAAPSPARALASGLNALSCPSATDCEAVGVYQTPAKRLLSYAEHWDGSRWTIGTVPPARFERDTVLNDVSCTAPGTCVAVGYTSGPNRRPVIMTLNNGRWSFAARQALYSASLLGISCPSTTECVAVGYQDRRALAELWNGSQWTALVPLRTARPRPDDIFTDVTCVAVSQCVAVGLRYTAKVRFSNNTLIEAWDGQHWRIQKSVNPT